MIVDRWRGHLFTFVGVLQSLDWGPGIKKKKKKVVDGYAGTSPKDHGGAKRRPLLSDERESRCVCDRGEPDTSRLITYGEGCTGPRWEARM